jgi:hypothetical protein
VRQVAVDHLAWEQARAVGRLNNQTSPWLQRRIQQGRQPDQFVAREMLEDIHGQNCLELALSLGQEVKHIARLCSHAVGLGKGNLLGGDIDTQGVRESTPSQIGQQPARAAANVQHRRRAIEPRQQRQECVVPPTIRRPPGRLPLERRHVAVVQRTTEIRRRCAFRVPRSASSTRCSAFASVPAVRVHGAIKPTLALQRTRPNAERETRNAER